MKKEGIKKSGKHIAIIIVLVIVITLALFISMYYILKQQLPYEEVRYTADGYSSSVKQFTTKEELNLFYSALVKLSKADTETLGYRMRNVFPLLKSSSPDNTEILESEQSSSSEKHTKTNSQVEGIDEADIVKTNGDYIFRLHDKGIAIMQVSSEGVDLVKNISFNFSMTKKSMLIYQNKLIVMYVKTPFEFMRHGNYDTSSETRIYNITDPSQPILEKIVAHSGYMKEARLKENNLYYVINFGWGIYGEDEKNCPIPKTYTGTSDEYEMRDMDLKDIYYFDGVPCFNYAIFVKIDLDKDTVDNTAYFGSGETIYMSHQNLYLLSYDTAKRVWTNGISIKVEHGEDSTRILKIDLENFKNVNIGKVSGSVLNKYSVDEYNGNLRIATTTRTYNFDSDELYSNVFVLDSDLKEIGKITNIAPGERIYSARFNKETGSIVTFRQVDPLFKLDLSDPKNPKISDGLKKEGVSYYLHYLSETRQVGIGYETKDGMIQGIEVVLYNMEGADAVIIKKIVIGDRGTSAEALYNPHAFLVDIPNKIIGFDINAYNYEPSGHYSERNRMYYMFDFSEDTIKVNYIKLPTDYHEIRGIRIDTRLFIVGEEETTVHDMKNNYAKLLTLKYESTGNE